MQWRRCDRTRSSRRTCRGRPTRRQRWRLSAESTSGRPEAAGDLSRLLAGVDPGRGAGEVPGRVRVWQAGEDARRGDGETYAEVGARSAECVTEWLERLGNGALLVAVTHGGTARATIGTLLDMPPDTWWRLAPLGNCRWSMLSDIGRGWRLEEHNAGSPPEEETGDDAR